MLILGHWGAGLGFEPFVNLGVAVGETEPARAVMVAGGQVVYPFIEILADDDEDFETN